MRCQCGAPMAYGNASEQYFCEASGQLRDRCDAPTRVRLIKQPGAFLDLDPNPFPLYQVRDRRDDEVIGVVSGFYPHLPGGHWQFVTPALMQGRRATRDAAVDALLEHSQASTMPRQGAVRSGENEPAANDQHFSNRRGTDARA